MSFNPSFDQLKKMERASVGSIEDEQAPSILMSTLSISDSSSLMDAASVDVSTKEGDGQSKEDLEDDLHFEEETPSADDLKAKNEHAILVSLLRAYFEAKKPAVSVEVLNLLLFLTHFLLSSS